MLDRSGLLGYLSYVNENEQFRIEIYDTSKHKLHSSRKLNDRTSTRQLLRFSQTGNEVITFYSSKSHTWKQKIKRIQKLTLKRKLPLSRAAFCAYSQTGRLRPTAEAGLLAIVSLQTLAVNKHGQWTCIISHCKLSQ